MGKKEYIPAQIAEQNSTNIEAKPWYLGEKLILSRKELSQTLVMLSLAKLCRDTVPQFELDNLR